MLRKVWNAQIHRRKIWRTYSLFEKACYYMKPFVIHLIIVWLQPLPVPTIIKVLYSLCLLVFILFPIIYPGAIFLASYWVFQYILQKDFGVSFSKDWDLHSYVEKIRNVDPTGEYRMAVYYYCERFKVMTATVITLIDYLRLAMNAIFGI